MRILKKVIVVVGVVVAVGVLALAAMIGTLSLRRNAAVREYEAQGFEMVKGCNGGAAVHANSQVHTIKQQLEEFSDFPVRATNVIVQLQSALVIAQEKARILSEDCRRRGHRETHPWKTNWITINRALTASDQLYQ